MSDRRHRRSCPSNGWKSDPVVAVRRETHAGDPGRGRRSRPLDLYVHRRPPLAQPEQQPSVSLSGKPVR